MQKNIPRKFSLGIISDTRMFVDDGKFVNESVLREVNAFSILFHKIVWMGYNYKGKAPSSTSSKICNNIKIKVAPFSGGNTFLKKIKVIFFIPVYFFKILNIIYKSDIVHTRGPSIPALITIFISFFFPKKIFWHKYAGDWQRVSNTVSYKFQAYILRSFNYGTIIVSKSNKDDRRNVLEWKNPCLYQIELENNRKKAKQKNYLNKLTFCFVGRIENAKGFHLVQDAINSLEDSQWIDAVHCVGENHSKLNVCDNNKFIHHGLINRRSLDAIYEKSHFIILPSASEGFPKVIIEAASFGCIPIVSSLDSINTHINSNKNNGFLLHSRSTESIVEILVHINQNRLELNKIKDNILNICKDFTYEKYSDKINNFFLK